MAKLYKTDGTVEDVEPKNGTDFSLDELQGFVHGHIEIVPYGDEIIVCNEEGKIDHKGINHRANVEYPLPGDFLVGDVLVCAAGQVK